MYKLDRQKTVPRRKTLPVISGRCTADRRMKKIYLILILAGLFTSTLTSKTKPVFIDFNIKVVDKETKLAVPNQMVLITSFNDEIPDTAYTDQNGFLKHTYRHNPNCKRGVFGANKMNINLVFMRQTVRLNIKRRYGHPSHDSKNKKVYNKTILV
jgi:hypothetical protein